MAGEVSGKSADLARDMEASWMLMGLGSPFLLI